MTVTGHYLYKLEGHFGKNVKNSQDKYPRNNLCNYHLMLISFFTVHF